jgi:glycosyltransferase involved in cell wall biosynthesis
LVKSRSVAYIYPYAFQYRREFHERLRAELARHAVHYDVIYSSEPHFAGRRGDLIAVPWAIDTRCSYWRIGRIALRYQHAFGLARRHDLVILQQENGLLLNYLLQVLARVLGIRTAFFGHGRNFQSKRPTGAAERFKSWWASRVDWWFAYTGRSAQIVAATGFDRERITVLNNAIDTTAIAAELASIPEAEREALRASLLAGSHNVGVFVGALYPEKRIGFLLEAAQHIRAAIPDFQLIIIGGGQEAGRAEAAAAEHGWIHYAGPKFGRDKSRLVGLGKVLLMPGLVGLAVLDAFAYGTPVVTCELAHHGPEIDYLVDEEYGLIVRDRDNAEAYAAAVCRVLQDAELNDRLRAGGRRALATFTVEAMVARCADGILRALGLRQSAAVGS